MKMELSKGANYCIAFHFLLFLDFINNDFVVFLSVEQNIMLYRIVVLHYFAML